jgi:hypothetical protein
MWPGELALVQPFESKPEAVSVPEENFDAIPFAIAKKK